MKINNKGFTLVELLAVVVMLSVLMAIMVPTVSYLIEENKERNYDNLEKSIISAAKAYLSDNRYNIKIESACANNTDEKEIIAPISDSKLPIKWLIESKYLSADSDGNITNPKDNKKLDLNTSYILIKYQCSTKDYTYTLESESLEWE